jgi:hypothetical protein
MTPLPNPPTHPLNRQYESLLEARNLLIEIASRLDMESALRARATSALTNFPQFDPHGNPLFFPKNCYNPPRK